MVTPAVPDNQCTPAGATVPTANVTVTQKTLDYSHLVFSPEIVLQGGRLDRSSVIITSGGGSVQDKTFSGYIRFRKPDTPGTTVIGFDYTISGTTYHGTLTVNYS